MLGEWWKQERPSSFFKQGSPALMSQSFRMNLGWRALGVPWIMVTSLSGRALSLLTNSSVSRHCPLPLCLSMLLVIMAEWKRPFMHACTISFLSHGIIQTIHLYTSSWPQKSLSYMTSSFDSFDYLTVTKISRHKGQNQLGHQSEDGFSATSRAWRPAREIGWRRCTRTQRSSTQKSEWLFGQWS